MVYHQIMMHVALPKIGVDMMKETVIMITNVMVISIVEQIIVQPTLHPGPTAVHETKYKKLNAKN